MTIEQSRSNQEAFFTYGVLQTDWPCVTKIVERYQSIVRIGNWSERSVKNQLFDKAICAYDQILFFKTNRPKDFHRLSIFIGTLVNSIYEWLHEQFLSKADKGKWATEHQYLFWIYNHFQDSGEMHDINHIKLVLNEPLKKEDKLRKVIYLMLVTKNIYNTLKGTDYENAIITGCLDTLH